MEDFIRWENHRTTLLGYSSQPRLIIGHLGLSWFYGSYGVLMWIWGSHRQIAHMLRRGACRRRLRCRSCQSRHRGMAPRRSTCAPGRRRPHGKKPLVNPVPRNIKIARVN